MSVLVRRTDIQRTVAWGTGGQPSGNRRGRGRSCSPSGPGAGQVPRGGGVGLLRGAALLTGHDVGGVERRPVVGWRRRLVPRVVLLGLPQEPGQRRDVHGRLLPVDSAGQRRASVSVPSWSSQPLPSGSVNGAKDA